MENVSEVSNFMVIMINRRNHKIKFIILYNVHKCFGFQPSDEMAGLHESPHTCCIHQFLMYTSVYKDSTAFWPAASGTQCKAKIRVT